MTAAQKFTALVNAINACKNARIRAEALNLLDNLQQSETTDEALISKFVANSDDYPGMFDAIVRGRV
jgi:hypothetical protein